MPLAQCSWRIRPDLCAPKPAALLGLAMVLVLASLAPAGLAAEGAGRYNLVVIGAGTGPQTSTPPSSDRRCLCTTPAACSRNAWA